MAGTALNTTEVSIPASILPRPLGSGDHCQQQSTDMSRNSQMSHDLMQQTGSRSRTNPGLYLYPFLALPWSPSPVLFLFYKIALKTTTAMTNEAERLNVATVPGRWHARLQAGTTPWATRSLTQAHHAGPSSSQLYVYEMHKSHMSVMHMDCAWCTCTNEWYWGSYLWEKCGYCAWRCLENAIIVAAKVFKKITSFWYCCVFS